MKAGMPVVPRAHDHLLWTPPGIGEVDVTVTRVARDKTWADLTCVIPERTWHRRQRLRRRQLPRSFVRLPSPMEIGMTDQMSLFEDVPATPVKVPKPVIGVKWSDYKPAKHVQCDDCVQVVHEAGGAGDIFSARRKRVTKDGTLVLCRSHGNVRHQRDVEAGLVGRGSGNSTTTRKPRRVTA